MKTKIMKTKNQVTTNGNQNVEHRHEENNRRGRRNPKSFEFQSEISSRSSTRRKSKKNSDDDDDDDESRTSFSSTKLFKKLVFPFSFRHRIREFSIV